MRNPTLIKVEHGRLAGPLNEPYGAFRLKVGAFRLSVIASAAMGWDHVSVSLSNRTPTWEEMDAIKRLFWSDDEVVMQLHINDGRKVNNHPFCLHLFRPQTQEEALREQARWKEEGEPETEWLFPPPIPLPPKNMV